MLDTQSVWGYPICKSRFPSERDGPSTIKRPPTDFFLPSEFQYQNMTAEMRLSLQARTRNSNTYVTETKGYDHKI